LDKVNYGDFYSMLSRRMKASEIRELLKLTHKANIISFAGGLPNPQAFPVDEMIDISRLVLRDYGTRALQYGATEGVTELREYMAEYLRKKEGMDTIPEEVIMTTGSQQGLDIVSRVFINPMDTIMTSAPTYLGALGAFRPHKPNILAIELDDDGMRTDLLEEDLELLRSRGIRPKFIYVVATFQNPTGVTLSASRRKKLLELAHEYDTLIIEDDPYSALRYSGDHIKTLRSQDKEGRVIYFRSFSKVLTPGFRLALIDANEDLLNKLTICKQSMDLCTPTFTQLIALEFMKAGLLEPQIEKIKRMYGEKRDLMLKALKDNFPPDSKWTKPEGGMFCWATLPHYMDTKEMFPKAVEKNVAYVIGAAFYPAGDVHNCMRLNFSHASNENITVGIERLASVIEERRVEPMKDRIPVASP